jgi:hypothetical protein
MIAVSGQRRSELETAFFLAYLSPNADLHLGASGAGRSRRGGGQ